MTEGGTANDRFEGLILDPFAPRQLFVADGHGGHCFIDMICGMGDAPCFKVSLYLAYADTREPECYDAQTLSELPFADVWVLPSRLDVLRQLPRLLIAYGPMSRVYVAGEAWFVEAVETLARESGLEPSQIMFEYCAAPAS